MSVPALGPQGKDPLFPAVRRVGELQREPGSCQTGRPMSPLVPKLS